MVMIRIMIKHAMLMEKRIPLNQPQQGTGIEKGNSNNMRNSRKKKDLRNMKRRWRS